MDKVFVRFHTKLKDHVITEERISIPSKLRRLGLSQVVNHLLGNNDSPIPFDFLINNTFLRSSLKKFIDIHNLHDEVAIDIEYVLALGEPETTNSFQHEDWVSAVDNHQNTHEYDLLVSACYDSIIRFWKNSKNKTPAFSLEGHTAPIKALSSTKVDNELLIVSASQDHTLRLWNVSPTSFSGKCTQVFIGHTGTVTSCDINPDRNSVVSGSWDYNIKIWNIKEDEDKDESETESQKVSKNGSKRRKIQKNMTCANKKPATTLMGHKQVVSAVGWCSKEEIVTGSWDYSLRFWDVESGINTFTKNGNKAIQSLSFSSHTQSVLTSHSDQTIRLWDKRSDHVETCLAFTSHKHWVSSVAFHPIRPEIFISGSYDNTLKVWDTRSNTPLYTIEKGHKDKVLTVGWWNNSHFLSGGADNMLNMHELK